ncbi:MAG: DegQ family serine endoprotease [Burkholderiales bacterium]
MRQGLAAALALGLAFAGAELAVPGVSFVDARAQSAPAPRSLPDFSALVEAYGPAVVNISTTERSEPSAEIPGQPGDPMYEFFRRFGPPQGQGGPMRRGQGSGFIISPDGVILTNAHVIADATEVNVRLSDRREFKAKVLGTDRRTDVGVLKIDARDLPSVRFGDPTRVKVGEWVAAIGSPFGLENTVTAGIVSAKSRSLPDETYVPFIQTDVAINPGNSGGPLFNLAGEVIGINSTIYSRTGGYMGLSFAVPIDVAVKVKDDLIRFGKVSRGRIGVAIQGLTQDLADSFGLDRPRGALVSTVEKGSPADRAGVLVGDVILAVDGRPVEQSVDLPRIIGETRPGNAVSLQVWRQGVAKELKVTVGEAPADRVAAAAPETSAPTQSKLGVAVRPVSAEEKQRLGIDGGVFVERADGPAARAGIRPGDVILAVGSQKIASAEELKRVIDAARERVALLVQRENAKLYVPVNLG